MDASSSPGPDSVLDLAALWDWEYDDDFVARLGRACAARSLVFASFHGRAIETFAHRVEAGDLAPKVVLDRVSDVMPGLIYHLMRLRGRGAHIVNDPERMVWCRDKGTMHLELLSAGVRVPYGVVMSTEDHPERLEILELAGDRLGSPFVIKPAVGGGGDGVVLDARTPRDVKEYFHRMGKGKVVLQRKVLPRRLGSRRGWFRVFGVLGEVCPCWWDDRTHVYEELSREEEVRHGLGELRAIIALIARVSGMDLFTTEVAVDEDGRLVAVDFVNEMPDLRAQSGHADGVPDALLDRIAGRLAGRAGRARAAESAPGKPPAS